MLQGCWRSLRRDLAMRRGAGGGRDVEPLEVEIEFHQRLAGEIDRRPAVERAVADRAGEAVDHDDRAVEPDLGLGRQRRLQQAGRIEREFDRNVLPLDRRGRRGRLDLEFERMLAGARAAGDLDLAVGADHGIGVDALDAVFDAVAQVGKHHRAVGDRDAIDRERIRIGRAGWTSPAWARRVGRARCVRAATGRYSTGRAITSSVICGWPDHTLASVMSAWMLPTVRRLLVSRSFGSSQRDVVQRHVQRRPQADLGRARYRQPVAGFAFDPVLDRRRQEARGDPDRPAAAPRQRSRQRWRRRRFSVLSCRHSRPGKRHRFQPGRDRAWPLLKLIPERGNSSKEPKIIRGCCKVM